MIEKIQVTRSDNDLTTKTLEAINKINELVDTVNKHEDIIRQIGEWGSSKGECLWCAKLTEVNLGDPMIGCTTLDIPESYKTDPYAEQRKWIGKLCWFWDNKKEDGIYCVLGRIDEDDEYPYVRQGYRDAGYKHCEPILEDIIYKGE